MTPKKTGPRKSAKVHTSHSGVSFVKARDVIRSENGRRAIEQSIDNNAKGRNNTLPKKAR